MSKFDKLFDIPEELSSDIPKITILDFNRMLIENYKCILEYQDFFIRIKMATGLININGYKLIMNEMTKDDLIITGIIEKKISAGFNNTITDNTPKVENKFDKKYCNVLRICTERSSASFNALIYLL